MSARMRIGRWQVWVAPDEFVWLEYMKEASDLPQFSRGLAPVDAEQLARSLLIAAGAVSPTSVAAERDAFWRALLEGAQIVALPDRAETLAQLLKTARSDSGRPPDTELSNQVRRDNGED